MTFWSWSRTAATNSSADSTINWAEGQAPSSVNDSARAVMAAAAKYRDDVSGAITTGGTSTAYTITSYQVFDTLAHMGNAVIAFVPHTTSGAAPTLAVDGLTAKKIRFETAIDLPSGVLIAGTPYVVTYFASVGEFIVHSIAGNPWIVPLGVALPFFGTAAPNSAFVLPYGQAISRTTYATLFTMFSTTYGIGDGSTTFNIPNLAGVAFAGADNMSGSDRGLLTGATAVSGSRTAIGSLLGAATHSLTLAQNATHNHTATDSGHVHQAVSNNVFVGTASGVLAPGGASAPSSAADLSGYSTGSGTASITVQNSGSGSAHNNVQPTIIGNYLMRVI